MSATRTQVSFPCSACRRFPFNGPPPPTHTPPLPSSPCRQTPGLRRPQGSAQSFLGCAGERSLGAKGPLGGGRTRKMVSAAAGAGPYRSVSGILSLCVSESRSLGVSLLSLSPRLDLSHPFSSYTSFSNSLPLLPLRLSRLLSPFFFFFSWFLFSPFL